MHIKYIFDTSINIRIEYRPPI